MTKYYEGIFDAQRETTPKPPFDIEQLRKKGIPKLIAWALEDPRWLLGLARRFQADGQVLRMGLCDEGRRRP